MNSGRKTPIWNEWFCSKRVSLLMQLFMLMVSPVKSSELRSVPSLQTKRHIGRFQVLPTFRPRFQIPDSQIITKLHASFQVRFQIITKFQVSIQIPDSQIITKLSTYTLHSPHSTRHSPLATRHPLREPSCSFCLCGNHESTTLASRLINNR
jgi:hypothetical protein